MVTVYLFAIFTVTTYFFKKINSREPSRFKYYFNFYIFYIISLLCAAVLWPYFLLKPKDLSNSRLGAKIGKHIFGRIYDLKWVLRNGHILSEEQEAVIVSNHQLSLDILGMFTIWDEVGKIAAIAKKQLLYVFPFGIAAYLAGVVFIDRNNPKLAYKQLQKTTEIMVKQKAKIWIFPEGTRNKDYTELLPFKKGAFSIAVAAQVPIIPVVFSPYYFVNAQKYIFSKGHIVIQALEPIPTKGLTNEDVPELVTKVHQRMSEAYKELSKEVLSELPANYPYTNVG